MSKLTRRNFVGQSLLAAGAFAAAPGILRAQGPTTKSGWQSSGVAVEAEVTLVGGSATLELTLPPSLKLMRKYQHSERSRSKTNRELARQFIETCGKRSPTNQLMRSARRLPTTGTLCAACGRCRPARTRTLKSPSAITSRKVPH